MYETRFKPVITTIILCSLFSITFSSSNAEAKNKVLWNPERVETVLGFEGVEEVTTTFTSTEELHDVEIWVVPELQRFVRVEPCSFDLIEQNVLGFRTAKTFINTRVRIRARPMLGFGG